MSKWGLSALLCAIALNTTSIKADSPEAQWPTWNVFGKDQRQPIVQKRYPWSTIGYLSTGCTGTLIAEDLILTAAHCVLEGSTKKLVSKPVFFYPNMVLGQAERAVAVVRVWLGTRDPSGHRSGDYAIAQISERIGKKFGTMGLTSKAEKKVNAAGYSYDYLDGRTAGLHKDCEIKREVPGHDLFFHACHMARGASGGPLFVIRGTGAYIVGLIVAERRGEGEHSLHLESYDERFTNIAIPTRVFLPRLKAILQKR